jgi:hypothetical protein
MRYIYSQESLTIPEGGMSIYSIRDDCARLVWEEIQAVDTRMFEEAIGILIALRLNSQGPHQDSPGHR